jgi:hypothetical protein
MRRLNTLLRKSQEALYPAGSAPVVQPSCCFRRCIQAFVELLVDNVKETLLALVRDLFTFSNKVIKRFIIV